MLEAQSDVGESEGENQSEKGLPMKMSSIAYSFNSSFRSQQLRPEDYQVYDTVGMPFAGKGLQFHELKSDEGHATRPALFKATSLDAIPLDEGDMEGKGVE